MSSSSDASDISSSIQSKNKNQLQELTASSNAILLHMNDQSVTTLSNQWKYLFENNKELKTNYHSLNDIHSSLFSQKNQSFSFISEDSIINNNNSNKKRKITNDLILNINKTEKLLIDSFLPNNESFNNENMNKFRKYDQNELDSARFLSLLSDTSSVTSNDTSNDTSKEENESNNSSNNSLEINKLYNCNKIPRYADLSLN